MYIMYSHKHIGYSSARYGISYSELKENYHKMLRLTDKQFVKALPEAIHLACIICWFKEIPTSMCLCDEGIVHQLAHILHLGAKQWANEQIIREIREQFKRELELV